MSMKTTCRLSQLLIATAAVAIMGLANYVGAVHTRFASAQESTPAASDVSDPPVLAYYYIWFDPSSWDRAKTDYPVLGRYSSDDPQIMRQHIEWAKSAGIDGFIVSWKNTENLSPRLRRLVDIASEEDFKLVIIYQGLNFVRDPLPIDQIAADLDYFIMTYGDNDVFNVFGRPAVIWSGTWKFSREEIAEVTSGRRDDLLILASEKQIDTYLALADLVDGNAYYWSSVDPESQPNYGDKLNNMAAAVHDQGGLWIAPAAPGFDARLIGGTRVVERYEGDTLLLQLDTARASAPDAVGIISWNEFSENSHIEPSCEHGARYLEVLANAAGMPGPGEVGPCPSDVARTSPTTIPEAASADAEAGLTSDFDSSSPGGTQGAGVARAMMIGVLMVLVGGSMAIVARRSRVFSATDPV